MTQLHTTAEQINNQSDFKTVKWAHYEAAAAQFAEMRKKLIESIMAMEISDNVDFYSQLQLKIGEFKSSNHLKRIAQSVVTGQSLELIHKECVSQNVQIQAPIESQLSKIERIDSAQEIQKHDCEILSPQDDKVKKIQEKTLQTTNPAEAIQQLLEQIQVSQQILRPSSFKQEQIQALNSSDICDEKNQDRISQMNYTLKKEKQISTQQNNLEATEQAWIAEDKRHLQILKQEQQTLISSEQTPILTGIRQPIQSQNQNFNKEKIMEIIENQSKEQTLHDEGRPQDSENKQTAAEILKPQDSENKQTAAEILKPQDSENKQTAAEILKPQDSENKQTAAEILKPQDSENKQTAAEILKPQDSENKQTAAEIFKPQDSENKQTAAEILKPQDSENKQTAAEILKPQDSENKQTAAEILKPQDSENKQTAAEILKPQDSENKQTAAEILKPQDSENKQTAAEIFKPQDSENKQTAAEMHSRNQIKIENPSELNQQARKQDEQINELTEQKVEQKDNVKKQGKSKQQAKEQQINNNKQKNKNTNKNKKRR